MSHYHNIFHVGAGRDRILKLEIYLTCHKEEEFYDINSAVLS